IFRSSLIFSSATRSLENPFAIRFAVGNFIAPHLRSKFSPSATHSSVSVTGYLKFFIDRTAFAISRLASRTDFNRFLLPRLTVAFITKPPNCALRPLTSSSDNSNGTQEFQRIFGKIIQGPCPQGSLCTNCDRLMRKSRILSREDEEVEEVNVLNYKHAT